MQNIGATPTMPQKIELSNGEVITIRPFSIRDLHALHRMYPFLSDKSKDFYREQSVRPRPASYSSGATLRWTVSKLRLILSTIGPIRTCLMYIPHAAFLPFVAVNQNREVVGFRYYEILANRIEHGYIATDGIVLRDDYQGVGLGTCFIKMTLEAVAHQIEIVVTDTRNPAMIHTYQKVGFKIVGYAKNNQGDILCQMIYLTRPCESLEIIDKEYKDHSWHEPLC
ncbi:MAG: GNAT family protein [Dehalococcoidia bacterium]|nr:GNAT family protein [Dehalococcoidia bacterium]